MKNEEVLDALSSDDPLEAFEKLFGGDRKKKSYAYEPLTKEIAKATWERTNQLDGIQKPEIIAANVAALDSDEILDKFVNLSIIGVAAGMVDPEVAFKTLFEVGRVFGIVQAELNAEKSAN